MKQFFVCRATIIFIPFLFIFLLSKNSFAQNVGIGITFPERAKLETRGQVGNTLALFGQDATGVSLVTNNPGIYFNSYSNGGVRSIQAGLTGNITFDAGLGRFQFNRTNHATGPDQSLTETQLLSIESNGNLIANVFRYPSPRTFYYSIPAADFSARYSVDTVIKESGEGGVYLLDQTTSTGIVAGVHLPHGATITGVTFHFLDETASTELVMGLFKYSPATSSYTTMAIVVTSGNPGVSSITLNTITQPNVDNINSTYMVRAISSPSNGWGGVMMRAVMISYTVIEGN